jgi:glutamate carboxypeptidase
LSNKQDKSNHYQEAIELIKALANINSHSYNLDGIAQVSLKIQAEYQKRFKNIQIEEIELPDQISVDDNGQELKIPLGKALRIKRINANAGAKPILLMGHMDTVFPIDSKFQTCKEINDNILNGPGVADLKGGLVVMMQALEEFEASAHAGKIAWQVFLNPDEEIGSPGSQTLFKDLASNNDLALIYEPGLEDGSIAYRRKGAGNFKLIARGKAAHVGRAFNEGASAILAVSDFIQAANKLNSESIIINFGKIEGGGPLNVVPDLASLGINIRIENNEDMVTVENQLNKIIDKIKQTENIKLELHGKFNRKPKIPDSRLEELYDLIASCAKELNIPISKKDTGGCCDGNNLYEHGLVNIDTLGVRGGKIHSAEEFVCLDSIEERVDLSLAILTRLANTQ